MIKRVKPEDHVELGAWYVSQSRFSPIFPKVGFRTENAACFILQTENKEFAFIEHLVKRPNLSDERGEVDAVILACLTYCKKHGVKQVCALTDHKSVVSRALSHGFSDTKFKFLTKEF